MVRIYFISFVIKNIKKSLFLYKYGDLKVYTNPATHSITIDLSNFQPSTHYHNRKHARAIALSKQNQPKQKQHQHFQFPTRSVFTKSTYRKRINGEIDCCGEVGF
jgi:hypothetical protein